MSHRILLLVAASSLMLASAAGARCLEYDPVKVTLTGVIDERLVPGPPDYKSIGRGDRPETIYFLMLDKPLCVKGDPNSTLRSRSHAGVEEVQLTRAPEDLDLVGPQVRATGSLQSAQSGEQRTPVVLNADVIWEP